MNFLSSGRNLLNGVPLAQTIPFLELTCMVFFDPAGAESSFAGSI